jgi:O-antigen ligase
MIRERILSWIDRALPALFFLTLALVFLRPSFLKISTPSGTVSLTSAKNIALVFCAVWCAALLLNPRRYYAPSGLQPPLLLFLAASCVSASLSPFGGAGERWAAVTEAVVYAAFFCGSLHVLNGLVKSRTVLLVLFPAAAAVALVDLAYHVAKGIWLIIDQRYPLWDGKNALGLFMVMSLSACSALAVPPGEGDRSGANDLRQRSGWRRMLPLCAGLFLMFLCAIYSYSRAAWVALAGAAFSFALMRSWKLVAMIVVAALALTAFPHRKMLTRLTATGGRRDRNVEGRVIVWKEAIRMIRERPLTGVGPGEFRTAFATAWKEAPKGLRSAQEANGRAETPGAGTDPGAKQRMRFSNHAHNLFLHVGAETGIPGLAALLWGTAAVFHAIRRRAARTEAPPLRALAGGIAAALAAFLTFSLVDCSWTGRFTGGSFMHINLTVTVLIAMLYADREYKSQTCHVAGKP